MKTVASANFIYIYNLIRMTHFFSNISKIDVLCPSTVYLSRGSREIDPTRRCMTFSTFFWVSQHQICQTPPVCTQIIDFLQQERIQRNATSADTNLMQHINIMVGKIKYSTLIKTFFGLESKHTQLSRAAPAGLRDV